MLQQQQQQQQQQQKQQQQQQQSIPYLEWVAVSVEPVLGTEAVGVTPVEVEVFQGVHSLQSAALDRQVPVHSHRHCTRRIG